MFRNDLIRNIIEFIIETRNKCWFVIINKYESKKFSNVENDSNTDVDWSNVEISKKKLKFEFDVSKSIFWKKKVNVYLISRITNEW